jgi:hypothetical protein
MASAFGPRTPWLLGLPPGIKDWTPDKDVWELYHLTEDWSQANDLAAEMPDKLAQLKELFLIEATKNEPLPIGGGLWIVVLHPEVWHLLIRSGTSPATSPGYQSLPRRRSATDRTS